MNEGQVGLRRNAARSANVVQRVSKAHAEHSNFARGLTGEKWSYRDNFFLNARNYFIFDKVSLRKSVRRTGKKIGAEKEKKNFFSKSFCRL